MTDQEVDQGTPAITFLVRSTVYALEQRGPATLLPWLQRFNGASAAPGLPPWCLGLLNVRGTVQLAIDLGYLLGYGQSQASPNSRLIFLERGPAQLGLLVDSEIGVRYLQSVAALTGETHHPFAVRSGLLETLAVTILDGAAIIRSVADELGAPQAAT